jgi:hypothetical protein
VSGDAASHSGTLGAEPDGDTPPQRRPTTLLAHQATLPQTRMELQQPGLVSGQRFEVSVG